MTKTFISIVGLMYHIIRTFTSKWEHNLRQIDTKIMTKNEDVEVDKETVMEKCYLVQPVLFKL